MVGRQFSYIISASIAYGYFARKTEAESYRKKVAAVQGATVNAASKTAKGYKFSATLRYGARTAAEKARAVTFLKKIYLVRELPQNKLNFLSYFFFFVKVQNLPLAC